MPLSVVIPTRNRPVLLRRAVLSVLRACSQGDEVIVVNDGGAEGLSEIDEWIASGRVVVCDGAGQGAASARNRGVSAARNAVVVFLDDDDEMIGGYPGRVRAAIESRDAPLWGASAILRKTGAAREGTEVSKRLSSGIQISNDKFRQKLFAASAGLWVHRDLFLDIGGFSSNQVIDEDSDLCCRFLAAGIEPWYEVEPGVVQHSGWEGESGNNQLTRTVSAGVAAACYLRTFECNSGPLARYRGAVWFLALRYIRRATALGEPVAFGDLMTGAARLHEKVGLLVYCLLRRLEMRVGGMRAGKGQ